ncbi:MAG TPA: CotO family spore coat protein [Lentibacillus sp.]|jgi:hypothetical protein|uniref:CotO family spore coat protein n=1 Tax=Lentibacillus sp. TaxID=1925746 RepID=UPI002B4ACE99|nr:CotO family spore coat protein [Lentibacillus sp.]HLR61742.1 CotO family spore coat protein [Lentibacillus sp.]
MGDHKSANSPLLYIQQPGMKTPRASMQSHYMTPKKKRADKIQANHKSRTRPVSRNYFKRQDDTDENGEDMESPEVGSSQEDGRQERKRFKDMTLEERIDYFLNAPKHAPVMRCEVKTEGRNYRGTIVDYQDNNVYMRVGKRTTPTAIPFDTINEIRLLGF